MANLSNINNKFLVTTTGEVLIGQTANDGNRLQITGADGASYIYLKTDVATTGGRIGFNSDDLRVFNQQASGNLSFGTAGTERMKIDQFAQIFAFGQMRLELAATETNPIVGTNCAFMFQNTSNTDGNLAVVDFRNSTGFVTGRIGAQFQDAGDRNTDLFFMTRANGGSLTERMRINSSGNVNLLNATATNSRTIGITNAGGTTGWTFGNGVIASSHQFVIYDNTAGSARMLIDSSGNVGINAAAYLGFNGAGDASHSVGYNAGIDGAMLRGQNGVILGTGGGATAVERMRIDSSGNVGIAAIPGAVASNIRVLRIGQRGVFSAYTTSGNVYMSNNVRVISNGNNTAIVTGESAQYRQADGTHIWYNAASVSAGAVSTLTERMRISSNGRTLITVASGNTIQDTTLQLKATSASNNAGIMFVNSGNTSSFNDIAGIASFVDSGNAKGNLQFWTRNTDGANTDVATRLTINSSGVATFTGRVVVNNLYSTTFVEALTLVYTSNGSAGAPSYTFSSDANTGIYRPSADTIAFSTGGSNALTLGNNNATFAGNIILTPGNSNKIILTPDLTSHYIQANGYWIDVIGNAYEVFRVFGGTGGTSEYLRVTGGGDILVGGNTLPAAASGAFVALRGGDNNCIETRRIGTGGRSHLIFYNGNGIVGNIETSGSSTAYNTSSDYRLKENVVEMTGALDRVSQLKPSRFNFIADSDTTVDGFLAHEVQEIVPEAITGNKDAVDDEGNPEYQGIDQSKLVPLLVGAIQELKAEIELLKNK